MDNEQGAPILSAIEQKPICILRRMQQRAQVGQEKEESSRVLLEHQEQLFSRTVTESHPQITPPTMEAVKKDQADTKCPPMVHDSVTAKNCDVTDSGESRACREDFQKQIQLLKTQMTEQQDHHDALRVFYEQQWDQVGEMIIRTLKAHEEQIKSKDYKINCLKKEKAANYSRHVANAREEVKKEMKGRDTANAFLKGKLETEEAKVKSLCNWITQSNALAHKGNSQRSHLQSLLSGHEQAAAQCRVEEVHDEDEIVEHFLKVIQVTQEGYSQETNLRSSAVSEEHRNKEPLSKVKTLQEVELLAEKKELCLQVDMLKSSLCEQERITAAALEQLEKARASRTSFQYLEQQKNMQEDAYRLHLEVTRLNTALSDENKAKSEAESKVVSLKGEINGLKKEVKNLELALNEERRNRVPKSQFTAIQKENAELQKERDKLRLQGNTLKSGILEKTTQEALRNDDDSMLSLREQEGAKEVSLHRVQHLEKEAQYMKRETKQLKSALSTKNMTKGETQCTDKNLMDERDQLHQEVKNLRSALREEKMNRMAQNEFTILIQEEKARFEAEMDQLRLQVSRQKSLLREKTLAAYEGLRKVKALEEERAKLQAERDGVCLQVGHLESSLVEKDTALKEAQNRIKSLEEETLILQSSVKNQKKALSKQQKDTEDAYSKVTQQEQEIRKQKATAQALEENLKSARDMFKNMVESCNAKFAAALAEKKSMEKKEQDLRQETERLTVAHRKEVSALKSSEDEKRVVLTCKIQELADALKASQENNSTLLTHNQELQETIITKEEHIQETENRRKQKKKWFGQCFGC